MSEKIAALMDAMTAEAIAAIESGIANPSGWIAPWHNVAAGAVNAVTHRTYTGGNFLWLTLMGGGPWATFNQWKSVGATVRKGEKGTLILVPVPVKFKKADSDGNEKDVKFTRFRTAYVFAAGQVDGWEAPEVPATVGPRYADADSVIEAWSRIVPIEDGANRAYYVPALDRISVPPFSHFKSSEGYYGTILHEIGHSTGHASRLNRKAGGAFGDADYAREELVAEFTAAFLGAHFGIVTNVVDHGHADYLANWLKALKGDPSLLWDAASDAQKAVRMILATVESDSDGE